MSEERPLDTWHVEAAVDAGGIAAIDEAPAVAVQLLDSNEIIEFSIKPSLWFVPIVSARFALAMIALAVVASVPALTGGGPLAAYAFVGFLMAACVRVLVAALQWASRLYILTNRRVMRCSGILNVQVLDCPLARVGQTQLKLAPYLMPLGIGSIRMTPISDKLPALQWEHVARPAFIHDRLVRAIRRAQHGD